MKKKAIKFNHFIRSRFFIPSLVILGILCWSSWYVWHWQVRQPLLEVYFLNIAHGSAVFIRTPNGKTALVGGGEGSDITTKLTSVTPFYRRHIDTLVIPLGMASSTGIADILGRFSVSNEFTISTSSVKAIALDEYAGMSVRLEPVLDAVGIRLSYGNSSILLLDELSRANQEIFLKNSLAEVKKLKNFDVMQLRSAASTRVSNDFLSVISPKYLVVSKLPSRPKVKVVTELPKAVSPKVVPPKKTTKKTVKPKIVKPVVPKEGKFDFYSLRGVKTYALDRKGTVEFISDGLKIQVKGEK